LKNVIDGFAIAVFLVLIIAGAAWWYPQKWQACQKLYDNFPAQMICFSKDD